MKRKELGRSSDCPFFYPLASLRGVEATPQRRGNPPYVSLLTPQAILFSLPSSLGVAPQRTEDPGNESNAFVTFSVIVLSLKKSTLPASVIAARRHSLSASVIARNNVTRQSTLRFSPHTANHPPFLPRHPWTSSA
jgi:hypothetical protein